MTTGRITEAQFAEIICIAKKRFPEINSSNGKFEASLRDADASVIDIWNGNDFYELKCGRETCSLFKVDYIYEKSFRAKYLWGCTSDLGRPGMDLWGAYYVPKGDVNVEDVFALDNGHEIFQNDIDELFEEQSVPDDGE